MTLNDVQPNHQTRSDLRVSDRVVDAISARIFSGDLPPGDRLPSEASIAADLGVSVPSVREGLAVLQNLDLVSVRHGSGRQVNGISLAALANERIGSAFATGDLLLQMLEIRLPLEIAAARGAAHRADTSDLASIEAAMDEMERVVLIDDALGVEADAEFHHAIAQAAHNQVLEMVDRALQPLYGKAREVGLSQPGRPTQVIEEHRAIVAAIRDGDADAAELAMCDHLGPLAEDAIERITTSAMAEVAIADVDNDEQHA